MKKPHTLPLEVRVKITDALCEQHKQYPLVLLAYAVDNGYISIKATSAEAVVA